MNGFYRDMAILALAIVAGVLWRIYSLVSRRGRRIEERETQEVSAPQAAKQAPIAGLPEYAAAHGWTGPATDPPAENPVADYVHEMFGNIWGYPRSLIAHSDF